MIFKIEVANKIIEISSIYDWSYNYCKDYLTEKNPDFKIEITSDDINFERERSEIKASDECLESLAIQRKIAEEIPHYNRILFHGSIISVDNEGYLFTAPSGIGKSTHTRLWKNYFGERSEIINDDKPFIEFTDKEIFIYGAPWSGKHNLNKNKKVRLKGICILSQDDKNWIKKIDKKTAYVELYKQVYHILKSTENTIKTLKLFDKLLNIPIYKMGCTISNEAVIIAYNKMKGEI